MIYHHHISKKAFCRLALVAGLTVFAMINAKAETTPPVFDLAPKTDSVRVAPDKILRSYDPITIFFTRDVGPQTARSEDAADKYVKLSPEVAGEWRWLGPRALQFRPAEPWTPLARYNVHYNNLDVKLISLLPSPVSASPDQNGEDIEELTHVDFTFDQPVDVNALKRLTSVEVRPAPGITSDGATMLPPSAYDILAMERSTRSDKQTYTLRFRDRISDGKVVIARLKLSDEAGVDAQTYEYRAQTASPFTVTAKACGRGWSDEETGDVLHCVAYNNDDEETSVKRQLIIRFSSDPKPIDILHMREALRITPAVDALSVENDGRRLKINGKFLADTIYSLAVEPGSVKDVRDRPLASRLFLKFAFTKEVPALNWDASSGVVERFGPQFVPLRGHGYDQVDIRIHSVDPLSRDVWPFPKDGVQTDDEESPPLPGKEPEKWSDIYDIPAADLQKRLKSLGSPAVSKIVKLPINKDAANARFGIDLSAEFASISGKDQPGTYLIGLRAVDQKARSWLRVQVTDLSLSVIEEPANVRFFVTSLATTQPVSGAQVRLEGIKDDKTITIATGVTDGRGAFSYTPGKKENGDITRIIVTKGADTLVLNPYNPPDEYANELWSKPEESWLSWIDTEVEGRKEVSRTLCHIFSDRPIYRPEDGVHIKGFVRNYLSGALSLPKTGGSLVISGPAQQEWRLPIKLDENGNFYHHFDEKTQASGDYSVKYEPDVAKISQVENGEPQQPSCGEFSFKKEAYRLPTFEVILNTPKIVPLDGSFNADLIARYFAGGLVADRPIKWRVAQYPYVFTPPHRDGFLFSTDSRFSGEAKFSASSLLERVQKTDASGASRLVLDTTVEATSQPRRYSIEATVTSDDGIEVRNVQSVIALPPFILGVKTPRYLERPGVLTSELIAVNGEGQNIADIDMTVRLIRRSWVSTLQASDFAQGSPKYVTQSQDETITEQKIKSLADAARVEFKTPEAGVYIVQLEAYDKLKRRQQVSVDFFVGGDSPITFSRPPSQTATISTDKDQYTPGEKATFIIQSPFQNAKALAIVEEPSGVYSYEFIDITNGYGKYTLKTRKEQMPKLAVHFLIMRGRLKDGAPTPTAPFDQGKPVTIAATKWININTDKHAVNVKIENPAKARPGQEIDVTIRITDDTGKPISGNATFWLVDQAVLSLAKEQPLEPVPSFIVMRDTEMAARDTRNLAFGIIPLDEVSGGDGDIAPEWGTDTNISVRKNFTPVPFYQPNIKIGSDGVVKLKVALPDSLTIFKLRAKVTSGADRFGATGNEIMVRQDIVAQPALPRFLRTGDSFDVGLVARIVEGPGGEGKASISAPDLKFANEPSKKIEWIQNRPYRFDVRADVSSNRIDPIKLIFRVERDVDRSRDAVAAELPVMSDRQADVGYEIFEIAAGDTKNLEPVGAKARPGSVERNIVVSTDPAIVKLMAGLNALIEYPYGCTEQRLALARASLALKDFSGLYRDKELTERVKDITKSVSQSIEKSIDTDGLVAFWPHTKGNVSLTAWSYSFLLRASKAGETVDQSLLNRLSVILERSMRSDFPLLMTDNELRERVEAISALSEGGKLDRGYFSELVRRAKLMPNISVAQAVRVASLTSDLDERVTTNLLDAMWSRVKFANRNGKQEYAGQVDEPDYPVILTSETKTLAEMVRASAAAAANDPRGSILRETLIRLGSGDGWGDTNLDAAAIEALSASWQNPQETVKFGVSVDQQDREITLDAKNPVERQSIKVDGKIAIANRAKAPLIAMVETHYVPNAPGAQAQADSKGFTIARQSWRIKSGAPPEKLDFDKSGSIRLSVGDVIEEVVEIVNPEIRTHVAVSVPFAAGYEPLNPALATAPAEAQPSFAPTTAVSWTAMGDDKIFVAYAVLPKGNHRFAFRLKAQTAGLYTQPAALVEAMYKKGVRATSSGAKIEISGQP